MIFSHSWNEKRLRKQIVGQINRRKGKSKSKRLLLIALVLFGLFLLYTNFAKKDKNQSLSTYKPSVSIKSIKNDPLLSHKVRKKLLSSISSTNSKSNADKKEKLTTNQSHQELASIDNSTPKSEAKSYSSFELNAQDIQNLEGLYRERLNFLK